MPGSEDKRRRGADSTKRGGMSVLARGDGNGRLAEASASVRARPSERPMCQF